MIASIGFPRMHKEAGERRVFLPSFVASLASDGLDVVLEEGYGSELELSETDFLSVGARFVDRRQSFSADLVIVLRAPEREEFALFRPGSILVSMLHFPTRSWRVSELTRRGVGAVAMDQIADDEGKRLVENLPSVAWNGLEAAFQLLERRLPGLAKTPPSPIEVLILGTGEIGRFAVDAGCKFGARSRNEEMIASGHPGVVVTSVGRNVTWSHASMRALLARTDILVDATQRRDSSRPVVPNDWIAWLPGHAVIADLSVDPYLLADAPPVVRGIEGIPRGNLDHYLFEVDDPAWRDTVPQEIPTLNRRPVASCYSWPGVHPVECMEHYGRQLLPLVRALIVTGYERLALDQGYHQRAVYRGSLRAFLQGRWRPISPGDGGR